MSVCKKGATVNCNFVCQQHHHIHAWYSRRGGRDVWLNRLKLRTNHYVLGPCPCCPEIFSAWLFCIFCPVNLLIVFYAQRERGSWVHFLDRPTVIRTLGAFFVAKCIQKNHWKAVRRIFLLRCSRIPLRWLTPMQNKWLDFLKSIEVKITFWPFSSYEGLIKESLCK